MSSRSSSPLPFHEFTGQPTAAVRKKTTFSQASTRRLITLFDQHGRQWWATAEHRSGMPVGQIEPKDFRAPWVPDQSYLVVNAEDASQLFIDYRTLATDRKVAEDEYYNDAVQLAADNKWPVPTKGDYDSKTLHALGRPPRALKLVLAAWQRNPWMLGDSSVPDPRLVAALERERPKPAITAADWTNEDFGPSSYEKAAGSSPVISSTSTPWVGDDPLDADTAAQFGADAFDEEAFQTGDEGEDVEETEGEAAEFESMIDGLAGESNEEFAQELEEEYDAGAVGGRTVHPKKADVVARQAPRRPAQSARGKRKRGPTLADGAKPVVAGD